jgi:O-6-methylguanine DNA methyltransferase
MKTVILPSLPVVGNLELTSLDGQSLLKIEVTKKVGQMPTDPFFLECYHELKAFLEGKTQDFKVKLDFSGMSDFQKSVLKAMKRVPYGKTATYKDLALKMNSKAYQAIGSACGRNPFLLIYPCHRILGSGNMGGFAHGLEMKAKLLELEKSLTR